MKLFAKFFGPYKVLQKLGATAYRLELLVGAQIHPVFHVSQFKQHLEKELAQSQLPLMDRDGLIAKKPLVILDKRMNKRKGKAYTKVLVQWSNCFSKDAT